MEFHKIPWYIILIFHSILMYFVKFHFHFWCFWKLPAKILSHSDWFEISKFQTLDGKSKKITITVIYYSGKLEY
jgi:hypothetical protein